MWVPEAWVQLQSAILRLLYFRTLSIESSSMRQPTTQLCKPNHWRSLLGLQYLGSGVLWWACLFLCMSVWTHISGTARPHLTKFSCMLPVTEAPAAMWYIRLCILPFLWTTLLLHTMARNVRCKVYSKWLTRGSTKITDVDDCLVLIILHLSSISKTDTGPNKILESIIMSSFFTTGRFKAIVRRKVLFSSLILGSFSATASLFAVIFTASTAGS